MTRSTLKRSRTSVFQPVRTSSKDRLIYSTLFLRIHHHHYFSSYLIIGISSYRQTLARKDELCGVFKVPVDRPWWIQ